MTATRVQTTSACIGKIQRFLLNAQVAGALVILSLAACSPVAATPTEPPPTISPLPTPEVPPPTQAPTVETRTVTAVPTPDIPATSFQTPEKTTAPIAQPTEAKEYITMPTPQPVRGETLPDQTARKMFYDRANIEIAKIEGIQSTIVTAQLEGEEYQAMGILAREIYGAIIKQNFLIKLDSTILILNDKVDGLDWSFDLSGINFKDNHGNIFGRVTRVKDSWTVKIEDYGIVQRNGLPVGNDSFPEGKPLLVKVKADASGKVIAISVMVSPNNWENVSADYFSRIKLTDQTIRNAVAEASRTPTPDATKAAEQVRPAPAKLMTYGGEIDFSTLPPTYDNAMKGFGQIADMKYHSGKMVIRLEAFNGGQRDYDLLMAGKPSQTIIRPIDLPVYVFEPTKIYYVNTSLKEAGPFIVEFMTVSSKGFDVNVRLKLPGKTRVLANLPLPFKWDFYEVSDVKAYAGGLMRPKEGDKKGDIIGFESFDLIQRMIDRSSTPGQNIDIDYPALLKGYTPFVVVFPN